MNARSPVDGRVEDGSRAPVTNGGTSGPRSPRGLALIASVAIALLLARSGEPPPERRAERASRRAPALTRSKPAEAARPPTVEPVRLLPVTPAEAIRINAAETPALDVGPAARPFNPGLPEDDGRRALTCLTQAIYYEAASEPLDGQRAVAQVVLNRVRSPAFPASVCGVVFQGAERRTGCQFTFTCDGSLRRRPSEAGWARARRVASEALDGTVFAPVGNATHYHADFVLPYWASSVARTTKIGAHIFYRWRGYWGRPDAFRQRHAGVEPETGGHFGEWAGAGGPLAADALSGSPMIDAERSRLVADTLPKSGVRTSTGTLSAGPVGSTPRTGKPVPSGRTETRLKADEEAGRLRVDGGSE